MMIALPTDGTYTLIPLRPDIEIAWQLMPQFLERVQRFAVRYTPETDVRSLLIYVVKSFPHMGPYFGFTLIANDTGDVVGHALVSVERENEDGHFWITIHHIESDVLLSDVIRHGFMQMVEEYAKLFQARELRLLALSRIHARYYRRWGFGDERIWMRKVLGDKEN